MWRELQHARGCGLGGEVERWAAAKAAAVMPRQGTRTVSSLPPAANAFMCALLRALPHAHEQQSSWTIPDAKLKNAVRKVIKQVRACVGLV